MRNVVFLGAYYNHHQHFLSQALARHCNYAYIATTKIPEFRKTLGWGMDSVPDYVCQYSLEPEKSEALLAAADLVITGAAPERLVRKCIRRGQLVFRYAERPLKKGPEVKKYLPRLVKWHWMNPPWRRIYMLCASAYTAGDYARFGLFWGRALRWGYFPEVKQYESAEGLLEQKNKATLLWAGRFIDWKHPDDVIRVAAKLKAAGREFEMQLIGGGELEEQLREMVAREGLEEQVRLLGSMKPHEVRGYMEKAGIYLFTSDRREGWGAVLNEAMNSGCAVIASHAIGSAPMLIRDGENGLLYRSGDVEGLYQRVLRLMDDPAAQRQLGLRAYETITESWNAETAAQRVIDLAERLLTGDRKNPYPDGPCSPAEHLRDSWYRG